MTITTFAVDANNNLILDSDGNVAILTGQDAVMQVCVHASKTILGEMIFFTDQGMPNFQTVWQPGLPNLAQFQTALRNTLMNVEGVTDVNDISTAVVPSAVEGLPGSNSVPINTGTVTSGKSLAYNATITTIYGKGVLSASVPI